MVLLLYSAVALIFLIPGLKLEIDYYLILVAFIIGYALAMVVVKRRQPMGWLCIMVLAGGSLVARSMGADAISKVLIYLSIAVNVALAYSEYKWKRNNKK